MFSLSHRQLQNNVVATYQYTLSIISHCYNMALDVLNFSQKCQSHVFPTPVHICYITILNNSHHGDLNPLLQVDPVPLLFHFRVVFFWFPWGSTALETSTEPRRCFLMLATNRRDIPESASMTTSRRQIGQ